MLDLTNGERTHIRSPERSSPTALSSTGSGETLAAPLEMSGSVEAKKKLHRDSESDRREEARLIVTKLLHPKVQDWVEKIVSQRGDALLGQPDSPKSVAASHYKSEKSRNAKMLAVCVSFYLDRVLAPHGLVIDDDDPSPKCLQAAEMLTDYFEDVLREGVKLHNQSKSVGAKPRQTASRKRAKQS